MNEREKLIMTRSFTTFSDYPIGAIIENNCRYYFSTYDQREQEALAKHVQIVTEWETAHPKPDYGSLFVGCPAQVENGHEVKREYKQGEYPKFTDEYEAWWQERYGAIEQWKANTDFAARKAAYDVENEQWQEARREASRKAWDAVKAEFPDNDGPESLRVVGNSINRHYAADPNSFDGDRWITVEASTQNADSVLDSDAGVPSIVSTEVFHMIRSTGIEERG